MTGPQYSATYLNGSEESRHHYDESDLDSSDSIDSMTSEEIENTFVERHGRRFHSHGDGVFGSYPFPVDEQEKIRMNDVHDLIKAILRGRNYVGPVVEVLSSLGHKKRVLDVCTGTGKWVDEMAAEFAEAKVYGVDIAPIASRFPHENAQFEIQNMDERTRWRTGRFDLVHLRQVSLCVRNYSRLLNEIARLLRPRGLFISGEWTYKIVREDGSNADSEVSGISAFLSQLSGILRQFGIQHVAMGIPQIIASSRRFENITCQVVKVPLDESFLGRRARRMVREFVNSAKPIFMETGYTDTQIEDMEEAVQDDLSHATQLFVVYQIVHARRNAIP